MSAALKITPEQVFKLKRMLPKLPSDEKRRILDLLKVYENQVTQQLGRISFLDFVKHVYSGYKVGPHHFKLAEIFEKIASGEKKRVVVNIAPVMVSLN